jgi:hypothetical protein
MNYQFKEIIEICMQRILDQKFMAGGYAIPAQDALNDVVQSCDCSNLRNVLYDLCNSVIDLMNC